MKLKKIAALALAGVMAVSMLAGCAGKGTDDKKDPTDTSGVTAAAVIGALDKDTTKNVTFNASSSLQATADKAMAYVNDPVANKTFGVELLESIDKNLKGEDTYLPKENDALKSSKKQTATFVVSTDSTLYGASDDVVVKSLAKKIADETYIARDNYYFKTLPLKSAEFTDATTEKYNYEFSYTADVAVVSQANEQGQMTYYVVINVTRTPSRVAVKG